MELDLFKELHLPLLATVVGSLLVFLAQLYHKRATLKIVLLAEINQLLVAMQGAKEYLAINDHYWLDVGKTIRTAPLDTAQPPRFYYAAMPDMHLFNNEEVRKIFLFFYHYEKTEGLKRNLFLRIREFAEAREPLDEVAVERLKIEKIRVESNYAAVLDSMSQPLKSLKKLPDSYQVESTASVSQKINHIPSVKLLKENHMCSPKHDPEKQTQAPKKEEQKESEKLG